MNKNSLSLLVPLLLAISLPALAQSATAPAAPPANAAHDHDAAPAQAGTTKQVHGCELMSEQEHAQHRQHMQGVATDEERQAYRTAHQMLMQQRAKDRGAELVPGPSPQCKGMQNGKGMQHGKHMQHGKPAAETPPAD